MTYARLLTALADPTRRTIVERLRAGPSAVGDLAKGLPVSRPAISQHLKVLVAAGLVGMRPNGTRRIYRLEPDGLNGLRAYLDALRSDALQNFARPAALEQKERKQEMTDIIAPVRKHIDVNLPPDAAFDLFTTHLAEWWPLASHSLSGGEGKLPLDVSMEPRTGGRIVETRHDGALAEWATILEWENGRRLVLDWYVGRDRRQATRVEIGFSPNGERGAGVSLVHDGFERHGPSGAAGASRYDEGWDIVLGDSFRRACAARS